jgi:hypothetical protein
MKLSAQWNYMHRKTPLNLPKIYAAVYWPAPSPILATTEILARHILSRKTIPDNEEEDNVISLPAQKQESSFYKYAFAASFALLIASTIALVNVYSKLQSSNEQLVALQADKQHFANQVKLMDNELTVYRDTTYKLLRLKGTAKTPGSALTVAFSPVHKRVIINMANMKMPVNDNAHQYQLWALVGGKPVDLRGV